MDADLMLFPCTYGNIIEAAIEGDPGVDVWTCMVTRVSCNENVVCPGGKRWEERDLVHLQHSACEHARLNSGKCTRLNTPWLAGYFLLFRKSLWKEFPFPEMGIGGRGGTKMSRVMSIDTGWSNTLSKAGKTFGLINGLLAVHYYSLDGDRIGHIRELEQRYSEPPPAVVRGYSKSGKPAKEVWAERQAKKQALRKARLTDRYKNVMQQESR
jgi:hypothetical protein